MALFQGKRNKAGRPAGKTPRIMVREELSNAVKQVVAASSKGDVSASVAVMSMALSYGDQLTHHIGD